MRYHPVSNAGNTTLDVPNSNTKAQTLTESQSDTKMGLQQTQRACELKNKIPAPVDEFDHPVSNARNTTLDVPNFQALTESNTKMHLQQSQRARELKNKIRAPADEFDLGENIISHPVLRSG